MHRRPPSTIGQDWLAEASDSELSRRSLVRGAVAGAAAMLAALSTRRTQAAAPPAYRIGCYTRPWGKQEYPVALDAIAAAGYKYIGLMTAKGKNGLVISIDTPVEEAAKIGQECKSRGLTVTSIWGGNIPVAKSLEAGIEGLRKLIDNVAAAGGTNLLMGGVTKPELHDPYYKAIAECCDYAAQKKIGLSIKPHGGSNATGPQCRKTVESVNKTNFKIWYDPGNIFYYSGGELNPIDDAATVNGVVVGMSVKDFAQPKKVEITPGTGQVDFAKVMGVLRKGGFVEGDLVVECVTPGEPAQTIAEARKAREFVEKLLSELK